MPPRKHHDRTILPVLWLLSILLIAACAERPPAPPGVERPALERLSPADFPRWVDDMACDGLIRAVDQSLAYLGRVPPDRMFQFGKDRFSTAHMIRSLKAFREFLGSEPASGQIDRFIRSRYRVYRSRGSDGGGRVLFTGYYEPFLRGSTERTERYRFPVYGRPPDLVRIDLEKFHPRFAGERIIARIDHRQVLPYPDREAISFGGILEGRAPVLAWVDDRVDLFFLQIQGSGRIFLDQGGVMNVHYHESNGRPYRSIGKLLIDEKKIDRSRMSMQAIRAYLRAHPEQIQRILTYNPSYVFFRIEADGPLGALGVPLTPGRSLAVDRRLFPDGALAFVQTRKPLVRGGGEIAGWTGMDRFVLNQDTGGAIRGAGRADLFWGNGGYAELAAGHMRHPGRLFFLVLSPDGG